MHINGGHRRGGGAGRIGIVVMSEASALFLHVFVVIDVDTDHFARILSLRRHKVEVGLVHWIRVGVGVGVVVRLRVRSRIVAAPILRVVALIVRRLL